MKDKLIKELLEMLNYIPCTAKQLKEQIENNDIWENERVILVDTLINHINQINERLEKEKNYKTPKTKFLYVEDGSVDLDLLEEQLFITNPEIQIVVYRQGGNPPIFIDKEKQNG